MVPPGSTIDWLGPAGDRSRARLKSSKQRVAVGGKQDVGRLDVAVSHVAAKRVVEGLGQPGTDPRDRLTVGEAREHFAGRSRRLNGRKFGSGHGIKIGEQVEPRDGAFAGFRARAARTAARVAPPQNGMQII